MSCTSPFHYLVELSPSIDHVLFHQSLIPFVSKSVIIHEQNDPVESVILPILLLLKELGKTDFVIKEHHCLSSTRKIRVMEERNTILHVPIPSRQCTILDVIHLYQQKEKIENDCTKQITLEFFHCILIHFTTSGTIQLLTSFTLHNTLYYLQSIICYHLNHFVCICKRNNNWYYLNDGQDPILLKEDEVLSISFHSQIIIVLYEEKFTCSPSTATSFSPSLFALPNNHYWCYQNAALQFLYSSLWIMNSVFTCMKLKQNQSKLESVTTVEELEQQFQTTLSLSCPTAPPAPPELSLPPESSYPFLKTYCIAITKQGTQCRNIACYHGYCGISSHKKQSKRKL